MAYDDALWKCPCAVLWFLEDSCAGGVREAASLPLAWHWPPQCRPYSGDWGDSLEMIAQRHPRVAERFVRELQRPSDSQHHQRDGARSGRSCGSERRPSIGGGGGGRAPVMRWSSVGSRHDLCKPRKLWLSDGGASPGGVRCLEAQRGARLATHAILLERCIASVCHRRCFLEFHFCVLVSRGR